MTKPEYISIAYAADPTLIFILTTDSDLVVGLVYICLTESLLPLQNSDIQ